MAFEYPLPEPLLIILQRQIPVGGFLLDGLCAAEFGLGVDEFLRAEGASALLALVTIGPFRSALRAGAHDVTVSKEGFGFRVVVLLAFPGYEFAFIVELAEELRGVLFMHLGGGSAIDVEIDAQTLETFVNYLVILVNYILWGAALLTGLDCDRHSMLVASADIEHIFSPHPEIADIDVGRDIDACQMSDVNRTVSIGQRAGYQCSLVVLSHNLNK